MEENVEILEVVEETMETFFVTIVSESISGIMVLAGIFIIFWASLSLYKEKDFSWRKVVLFSLLAGVILEILLLVLEVFIPWELFIYLEALIVVISSSLFMLGALTFLRLVNYAKNT